MTVGYSIKLSSDWDLCLDEFGNIMTCQGDEAICQDVACALRLFNNECYFEPNKGVPYFDIALGVKPFETMIRCELTTAAKSVRGVMDAALLHYEITPERTMQLAMECTTANKNLRTFDLGINLARG